MRAVLDSNVIISALINPAGTPGQILSRLGEGRFELHCSEHLWQELLRATSYKRVQKILESRGLAARVQPVLASLRRMAKIVPDAQPAQNWVTKDPDDDWVIQCALDAGAERIVTGDPHLLALRVVGDASIVTPAVFLNELVTAPDLP